MKLKENNGIYRLTCFSNRIVAVFSGRQYANRDHPLFLRTTGFSETNLGRAHQKHGKRVLHLAEKSTVGPLEEADGLVTQVRHLALVILTADCLPVFFEDAEHHAIGMVHAGWRGLRAGILEETTHKMEVLFGTRPSSLRVAIGPAIRACCYEVGPEFKSFFPEDYDPGQGSHQGRVDLAGVAKRCLGACGVRESGLTDTQICTSCENRFFYSARRERGTQERTLSLIALRH